MDRFEAKINAWGLLDSLSNYYELRVFGDPMVLVKSTNYNGWSMSA